jgi:hypothetical protein
MGPCNCFDGQWPNSSALSLADASLHIQRHSGQYAEYEPVRALRPFPGRAGPAGHAQRPVRPLPGGGGDHRAQHRRRRSDAVRQDDHPQLPGRGHPVARAGDHLRGGRCCLSTADCLLRNSEWSLRLTASWRLWSVVRITSGGAWSMSCASRLLATPARSSRHCSGRQAGNSSHNAPHVLVSESLPPVC